MPRNDIEVFLGKQVIVQSKKLHMTVSGFLEAIICDVVILQGMCCWGINCDDITTIIEKRT